MSVGNDGVFWLLGLAIVFLVAVYVLTPWFERWER